MLPAYDPVPKYHKGTVNLSTLPIPTMSFPAVAELSILIPVMDTSVK